MYASEQRKAIPFHKLSWSDDAQLAQFCEDAWEHRSAEQQRAEQWGELVAAWYEGNQYLALTNVGMTNASDVRLATLDDFGRNRYVFNLFAPHLDQFVAKVAMDPLEPEAVPRSGSLPDLDAARLQTGVCQYYRDLLDLQHTKDELMKIIAMDAMGFTKVVWDPLAGNEFASMGPRPFGRGDQPNRRKTRPRNRFNGAAAFRPRRHQELAQRVAMVTLQWGRGLSAAETSSCRCLAA